MAELKTKYNMFKLNEPIGRISFIKNLLIIVAIHLFFRVTTHYFKIFVHGNTTLTFCVLAYSYISALLVYYLIFINTTKRFWDIFQSKIFGIVITSIFPIIFIESILTVREDALLNIPIIMLLLTIYLSIRGKSFN